MRSQLQVIFFYLVIITLKLAEKPSEFCGGIRISVI